MWELWGVEISPLPLKGHIAYTTPCCYRTSRDHYVARSVLYDIHVNIAGASCTAGDLSMNSKCYRKVERQLTWYSASNDCLSRGGSLAVFTDIGRPSDNNQLINWLNTTGTGKTYWIGLIRSWWKTTNKGNTWIACLYMMLMSCL